MFWSFLYTLEHYGSLSRPLNFARAMVRGHYHLWYLYFIIGLYMLVPLLRQICADERLERYALALWLAVDGLPSLLCGLFPDARAVFVYPREKLCLHALTGYGGYLVLGHYLTARDLSRRARQWLAGLAIGAGLFTVISTIVYSLRSGEIYFALHDFTTVNVVLYAAGVFVLFQGGFGAKRTDAEPISASGRQSAPGDGAARSDLATGAIAATEAVDIPGATGANDTAGITESAGWADALDAIGKINASESAGSADGPTGRFAGIPPFSRRARALSRLASLSFGVYLIHDFCNIYIGRSAAAHKFLSAFPPLTVLLAGAAVFLFSALIAGLLSRLPFGEYLVGASAARRRPSKPKRPTKRAQNRETPGAFR